MGESLPLKTIALGYVRIEGSIAADFSNGDLYVPDSSQGQVSAYTSAGTLVPNNSFVKQGSRLAFAIDNSPAPSLSSGRIYVARVPHEGGDPFNGVELITESGNQSTFHATRNSILLHTSTKTCSPVPRLARSKTHMPSPLGRTAKYSSRTLAR